MPDWFSSPAGSSPGVPCFSHDAYLEVEPLESARALFLDMSSSSPQKDYTGSLFPSAPRLGTALRLRARFFVIRAR